MKYLLPLLALACFAAPAEAQTWTSSIRVNSEFEIVPVIEVETATAGAVAWGNITPGVTRVVDNPDVYYGAAQPTHGTIVTYRHNVPGTISVSMSPLLGPDGVEIMATPICRAHGGAIFDCSAGLSLDQTLWGALWEGVIGVGATLTAPTNAAGGAYTGSIIFTATALGG